MLLVPLGQLAVRQGAASSEHADALLLAAWNDPNKIPDRSPSGPASPPPGFGILGAVDEDTSYHGMKILSNAVPMTPAPPSPPAVEEAPMSPPPPPIEPGVQKCAECWLRAWEDAHAITSPIGLDEGRLLIPNGHTGPGRPQSPWRPAESWASSRGHHVDGDRGSPEQLVGRGDTWQDTVDWSGRIPSRIFQLAADREYSRSKYGRWMDGWAALNHEFAYYLFNDDDCASFIEEVTDLATLQAWSLLKPGVPRADLCRVALLAYLGGVYVDTDVEPRAPLRFVLPNNASAVAVVPERIDAQNTTWSEGNASWSFKLLAFARRHPIMTRMVLEQSRRIYAMALDLDSPRPVLVRRCGACTWTITGPFAFFDSVRAQEQAMDSNCSSPFKVSSTGGLNVLTMPRQPEEGACPALVDKAMRNVHVYQHCRGDEHPLYMCRGHGDFLVDLGAHHACGRDDDSESFRCEDDHYSNWGDPARGFRRASEVDTSALGKAFNASLMAKLLVSLGADGRESGAKATRWAAARRAAAKAKANESSALNSTIANATNQTAAAAALNETDSGESVLERTLREAKQEMERNQKRNAERPTQERADPRPAVGSLPKGKVGRTRHGGVLT